MVGVLKKDSLRAVELRFAGLVSDVWSRVGLGVSGHARWNNPGTTREVIMADTRSPNTTSDDGKIIPYTSYP